jgi:maleylacetoacetate isomerase/maleylpyruvate isomerase
MGGTAFKLHGYFRSSTSFRVRMALNLKGLNYDYVPVNLLMSEHKSDEYLKLNPQGLVPALEHEGHIITQSLAILEYLDDIAPSPALVYGSPAQKAKIRALAHIIACDIHPMNNISVWKGYLGKVLNVTEEQSKSWYAHWIMQGLSVYEEMMEKGSAFSCGNDISLADICLLPQLYNARRFNVPLEAFANILRTEQNMLELEAIRAALPEAQPDAPADLKPIYNLNHREEKHG